MSTDEETLKQFRQIATIPELKDAKILSADGQNISCESYWNVRNLATLKRTPNVSHQHYNVAAEFLTPFMLTPALENVNLMGYDAERKRKAYLIQTKDTDDPKRFLTIQSQGELPSTVDLSKTELHGQVYSDVEFGSLNFSPDGKFLSFSAEKYSPKMTSLLDPANKDGKNSEKGDKFLYKEDWGEQLTGQHKSVIVVIPTDQESAYTDQNRILLSPPDHYDGVGQIQWSGSRSLVGVAYYETSPRLGLIYCRIRESVLFHVSLDDKKFVELTPRGEWVGSPRLSPNLSRLVYLSGPMGGTHVNGCRLVTRSWGSDDEIKPVDPKVVIDYYMSEETVGSHLFSGLYGKNFLPTSCFVDDRTIVLSSEGRCQMMAYLVDLNSGSKTRISADTTVSVTALDAFNSYILTVSSSFSSAPRVEVYQKIGEDSVELVKTLTNFTKVGINFTEDIFVLPPNEDNVTVPVLYVSPSNAGESTPQKKPLIVFIHGGPHSSITTSYSMSVHLFSILGYQIIFPNYRGSLGVGANGISSLVGRVGDIDVKDCHEATLEALKKYEDTVDPSNIFLYGGSHGGFLVTHLSAAYPDFYRAVSTRNPVTDIATMAGISDIPDWTLIEACGTQDYTSPPTVDNLRKMMQVSPVFHINRVKAPTLLQLGSEDKRVPMSQGIKYHQFLKHRNIPTRLLVYEDCHSLRKIEIEADCLLQTLSWFRKYKK